MIFPVIQEKEITALMAFKNSTQIEPKIICRHDWFIGCLLSDKIEAGLGVCKDYSINTENPCTAVLSCAVNENFQAMFRLSVQIWSESDHM